MGFFVCIVCDFMLCILLLIFNFLLLNNIIFFIGTLICWRVNQIRIWNSCFNLIDTLPNILNRRCNSIHLIHLIKLFLSHSFNNILASNDNILTALNRILLPIDNILISHGLINIPLNNIDISHEFIAGTTDGIVIPKHLIFPISLNTHIVRIIAIVDLIAKNPITNCIHIPFDCIFIGIGQNIFISLNDVIIPWNYYVILWFLENFVWISYQSVILRFCYCIVVTSGNIIHSINIVWISYKSVVYADQSVCASCADVWSADYFVVVSCNCVGSIRTFH